MFGFLKPYKEEFRQLRTEQKQLEIEKRELKKQVDKLIEHIQNLEKERILFKGAIEIAHKELENTEKELNAKSKQFLSLEKENKELKTKLDEAEQVNIKLQVDKVFVTNELRKQLRLHDKKKNENEQN